MSFWDGRYVHLWHGTTLDNAQSIAIHGPNFRMSRASLDFGRGFYTTTKRDKAAVWAFRNAGQVKKQAALIRWSIEYDAFVRWPMLVFVDNGKTSHDFWEFVQNNRTIMTAHRSQPLGYFDIVAGPASINFIKRMSVPDFEQISFHTNAGLRCLNAVPANVFGL